MNTLYGNKNAETVSNVVTAEKNTLSTEIMVTTTTLSFNDFLGAWKARWGINRMNYKVNPGLYKIGTPKDTSPVLVTANYKLTFDSVRKELAGLNVWLLVVDTNGVNVWCAAGKGTFGTEELIRRIAGVKLSNFVNHRTIILPQLGAPGVAAHAIKRATGFLVIYGPVYAKDIREFIANGQKAHTEMRRVRFGILERLKVVPVEIIYSWWLLPVVLMAIILFNILDGTGISWKLVDDFIPYAGAYAMGTFVFQIVLPWLPGRSFAFKGWLLGLTWAIAVNLFEVFSFWHIISHLLIIPVIVSFWALNFTGATTFTSRSGVLKEMRIAIPLIIAGLLIGVFARIIPAFIN
jgi:hypothetical protein